jgi:hypothetical protein
VVHPDGALELLCNLRDDRVENLRDDRVEVA